MINVEWPPPYKDDLVSAWLEMCHALRILTRNTYYIESGGRLGVIESPFDGIMYNRYEGFDPHTYPKEVSYKHLLILPKNTLHKTRQLGITLKGGDDQRMEIQIKPYRDYVYYNNSYEWRYVTRSSKVGGQVQYLVDETPIKDPYQSGTAWRISTNKGSYRGVHERVVANNMNTLGLIKYWSCLIHTPEQFNSHNFFHNLH